MFRVRAHNEAGTSEPTLPVTLERQKKKAPTPQRRGSSVERRSLDRRSMDRKSVERRSLDRQSLERRSESRLSRRDGSKIELEEETLPGMTPDDSRECDFRAGFTTFCSSVAFCLWLYILGGVQALSSLPPLLTCHESVPATAPEFSSVDKEDVQFGVESHPMNISLQLRGYPPPQVTWYHQGKKLELGERYDTYVTPTGKPLPPLPEWD